MRPDPQKLEELAPPGRWMLLAESNLALARMPLPSGMLYEQLCYGAQQAAEKSLQAVLVFRDLDFPMSSTIERLVELLPSDISRPALLEEAAGLTAYALSRCYPPLQEPVEESDYREALRLAESVVAWAKAYLESVDTQ
jgi:HEPN domain-containing protein